MARYPSILVLKEKHDDSMFLIQSPDDFARVAASTVLNRAKEGYYYPSFEQIEKKKIQRVSELEASLSPADKELLVMDESEIIALPEKLSRFAIQVQEKFMGDVLQIEKSFDGDLELANLVKALRESDAPHELLHNSEGRSVNAAIHILDLRASYQYEDYELEQFSAIPTVDEVRSAR